MERVMIAVDAGGTKTKVCAFNHNKEKVYETIQGPGAPQVVNGDTKFTFLDQIKTAVEALKTQYDVVFIQLGVSGLGIVPNCKQKEGQLSEMFGVEVSLENDAIIGLYSLLGIPKHPTILVLAGTGSSTLAFSDKKTLLVGGFGHMLTEKGSSFTAVKTLISQIIEKYETSQPLNQLETKFMDMTKSNSVYDLKPFVYLKTKSQIADYAKFISQEALANDEDAMAILKSCGRELAGFVIKAHKKMNMKPEFYLGFRGSFILKAPFVQTALLECLYEHQLNPNIIEAKNDPVEGAYYLALEKGKI